MGLSAGAVGLLITRGRKASVLYVCVCISRHERPVKRISSCDSAGLIIAATACVRACSEDAQMRGN